MMNFGQALEVLKAGGAVARSGWNGKGMWIALTPGSTIHCEQARSGAALRMAGEQPIDIRIAPHIDMRAADGTLAVGWLASQADMLADDWIEIEPPQ